MKIKYLKFLTAFFSTLILLPLVTVSAVTELERELGDSYQYGYWKDVRSAPAPYVCTKNKSLRNIFENPSQLEDLAIGENGNCYIVDKGNSCVYIIDSNLNIIKTVKEYIIEDKAQAFEQPEGIFALRDKIYIANTAGKNIVIMDKDGNTLQVVPAPSLREMATTVDYEPIKISADSAGRLFVISRNQTQGILRLSKEGGFLGYLGAVRVTPTPMQLFFRLIASEEMIKKSVQFIPTEYGNLTTDKDGFVYCIVSTVNSGNIYSAINARNSATVLPIRKINSTNNDILKNLGFFPPIGDIEFSLYGKDGGASILSDITVDENGNYCLLDSRRNRVFIYNKNGDLLFVFGGTGNGTDQLSQPVAISYCSDSIYVLDKKTEMLKCFTPTPYAEKVYQALRLHSEGKYEKETVLWNQVKREYIGSDLAYLGIGKNAYISGDYNKAMECFKIANNKDYYSKAKGLAIRKGIESRIYWLLPLFTVLAVATITAIYYLIKFARKSTSNTVQGVLYGGHVILHPFDGFWDMRHEKKGNMFSATIILGAAYLINIMFMVYKPYIFQELNLDKTNIFVKSLSDIVLPIIMWVIANWCFTTLFDGKGTISDIYTSACYSLFPFVAFIPIISIVSQVLTIDAQQIYNNMLMVVYVWVGFLLFSSTLTIHQFSFTKTVVMIILTLFGIAIIIFIAVLCISLLADICSFIQGLFKEILHNL